MPLCLCVRLTPLRARAKLSCSAPVARHRHHPWQARPRKHPRPPRSRTGSRASSS
ncbi:MAG: hypothetical protein AVDCRST_MAG68-3659 [uncultured Gemmatimonadetes bacterium]|uniref:Uncharacterized protein n=1 Tax=uncultured Gemmatimonadota bacterium TaxID=203437 RepID=A0A6J4M911_9BACT|nr:MAG: hypothetical protein AVDCRST_MAG68-3659 [uncultured Gemmatimonadota bacterium]